MNKHEWYVLQVKTGYEEKVAKALNDRGYVTLVPIENRMIRRGGKWIEQPYIVFSGYVFVYLNYSWARYYAISGVHGVIKLLGGGVDPTPLSINEATFIKSLSAILDKPSVLEFTDSGDYKCISGFLEKYADKIVKIEKRYKRATVLVSVAGEEKQIKVSFTEQTPARTED